MKIGTPTGYDDPIWNQVSSIPLDYFKTATNVAEGRTDSQIAKDNQVDAVVSYKVMYDDTYIYYLYDVTDANYQEVGTYCSAGRDWSKNGIFHVYPKLAARKPPVTCGTCPRRIFTWRTATILPCRRSIVR